MKDKARAEMLSREQDRIDDHLNQITAIINGTPEIPGTRSMASDARAEMLTALRTALRAGDAYRGLLYGEQRRAEEGY
jgi:hypothetical protein